MFYGFHGFLGEGLDIETFLFQPRSGSIGGALAIMFDVYWGNFADLSPQIHSNIGNSEFE